MTDIISSGNEEFDLQFGGGIPTPSLMLIEGDHGTGKSAIAAQLMSGLLAHDRKVLCITENTVKAYIDKMKAITYDFTTPFVQGRLSILPLHIYGKKWSEKNSKFLLPILTECIENSYKKCDTIIIDSLSLLTIYTDTDKILDFFSNCKHMVANGLSIIITIHPDDISEEVARRVKASCDVYLKLGSSYLGTTEIKTVKIVKLIGSKKQSEATFAFVVDTVFGIKIVPITMANV